MLMQVFSASAGPISVAETDKYPYLGEDCRAFGRDTSVAFMRDMSIECYSEKYYKPQVGR